MWHHSNGQQGAEFRGIEFYMDINHITSGNVIQITDKSGTAATLL